MDKLFGHHQEEMSLKRYVQPIICLIAMLFRAVQQHYDEPNHWINYHSQLAMYIQGCLEMNQSGVLQSDEDPITPQKAQELLHPIMEYLWTTIWSDLSDDALADPTHRFCVWYSLEANGHQAPVQKVTKLLAALKYCLRLHMLTSIRTSDKRPRERCEELEPWFKDKMKASTFSTISNHLRIGFSLIHNNYAPPRFTWPNHDDLSEFKYQGNATKIDDIRAMIAGTEDDLVTLWEESIIFNTDIHVPLDGLTEDLSDTTSGYSFITDRRNNLAQYSTALLDAISTNPYLLEKFTVCHGGKREWRQTMLGKWLQNYSELCKLLMIRCELLGGGPRRGTELVPMIFCSSAEQPIRNLSIYNKHVMMLATYSKSTARTGTDRIIPHSLDAITSDLIIQSLAIARPFAQLAASILYPGNDEVQKRYQSYIFVNNNRLFNTNDLSKGLKYYSNKYLGHLYGVNDMRHIIIGVRRKYGGARYQDMVENEYQDMVGAEQAGHTWGIEKRIYGLSPDAFAGPTEDIIPQFLDASVDWQRNVQAVHGKLFSLSV